MKGPGKQWLGSPVFIVEGEDENRMGQLSVTPAFLVDSKQFDQVEADFKREEVHLRIMLDSFNRKSKQGTLEPLSSAAKSDAQPGND